MGKSTGQVPILHPVQKPTEEGVLSSPAQSQIGRSMGYSGSQGPAQREATCGHDHIFAPANYRKSIGRRRSMSGLDRTDCGDADALSHPIEEGLGP